MPLVSPLIIFFAHSKLPLASIRSLLFFLPLLSIDLSKKFKNLPAGLLEMELRFLKTTILEVTVLLQ